jgi:multicomponent Na+:H+ antiporter subunit E
VNALLLNLLVAMVWAVLMGEIDLENLGFGFLLGYAVLAWLRPVPGARKYTTRLPRGIVLLLYFLWELILSSFRVARDVLSPHPKIKPGIIGVPLDAKTDNEITLLACLITLTPGTLTLDVSDDRKTLYVHSMWVTDPESVRREIKDGFERHVLEFLR